MATTITATVKAALPIPYIQIDVTIDNPATVTAWSVYRDTAGEPTVPIFVGTTSSGAMSVVDTTCPLGVSVTYRLVVTYSGGTQTTVTAAPVTITGTVGCYLTSAVVRETMQVELQAWPERIRMPRQATIEVLSRPDPVGLTDVHSTPAGQWTVHTRTDAETTQLVRILTALGAVVTLRTQPGSSIASCTALIGEVNERRYNERDGADQRRLIDVKIREIAPLPATALPLASTLQGLSTIDGSSLSSLSSFRATLLQLSMVETG